MVVATSAERSRLGDGVGGRGGLLLPPPSFHDRRTTTASPPRPSSSSDDSSIVVFGLAWCPPLPSSSLLDDDEGDGVGKRKILVACTNRGDLRFFDVPPGDGGPSSERDDDEDGAEEDGGGEDRSGKREGSRKKRLRTTDRGAVDGAVGRSFDGSPALRVEVTDGTLYHVQFHGRPSPSTTTTSPLLLVSGVGGVWSYKWSAFLPHLRSATSPQAGHGRCNRADRPRVAKVEPIAIHRPYPSPYDATPTEINSLDVDPMTNRLYGAAGDGFGVYAWDLETERLLRTFGGGGRSKKSTARGHEDYLHSVKVVRGRDVCGGGGGDGAVLTGGEDGRLGMWDAKSNELVEFFDVESILQSPSGGYSGASSPLGTTMSSSWIADIDVEPNRADWAVLCGGIENNRQPNRKTQSDAGGGEGGGFVSILHLPTRSVASSSVVRETVQTAAYRNDEILTLGNEGVVSSWGSTDLTRRRGRGWCSCPSGYAIAVEEGGSEVEEGGRAAVGGVGNVVDVFRDAGHRSFRLTLS